MKKLIAFDLDGTLAESKASLDAEMAKLLTALLVIVKVAVISGGDWPQFEKQVLAKLPRDKRLKNLSLLPTCGTKFYRQTKDWKKIYSEDFTADEKMKIISSLKQALETAGFKVARVWGETIEDRGSQITFSALAWIFHSLRAKRRGLRFRAPRSSRNRAVSQDEGSATPF